MNIWVFNCDNMVVIFFLSFVFFFVMKVVFFLNDFLGSMGDDMIGKNLVCGLILLFF